MEARFFGFDQYVSTSRKKTSWHTWLSQWRQPKLEGKFLYIRRSIETTFSVEIIAHLEIISYKFTLPFPASLRLFPQGQRIRLQNKTNHLSRLSRFGSMGQWCPQILHKTKEQHVVILCVTVAISK